MLFSVLIIITCVLLILIILIQNPKGGGLSSSFGGSGTQVFGGVKKTTDFLDKGTWGLSIALVALVLLANVTLSSPQANENGTPESEIENVVPNTPSPAATPLPTGGGTELPESVDDEQ